MTPTTLLTSKQPPFFLASEPRPGDCLRAAHTHWTKWQSVEGTPQNQCPGRKWCSHSCLQNELQAWGQSFWTVHFRSCLFRSRAAARSSQAVRPFRHQAGPSKPGSKCAYRSGFFLLELSVPEMKRSKIKDFPEIQHSLFCAQHLPEGHTRHCMSNAKVPAATQLKSWAHLRAGKGCQGPTSVAATATPASSEPVLGWVLNTAHESTPLSPTQSSRRGREELQLQPADAKTEMQHSAGSVDAS